MVYISLIIPVYNVEKYLEKCLNSCVQQNISENEYEIIIINDGSTDDSPIIAKKFESNQNNIILITQQNQGLSAARNKGLSIAKGEYVWFIDSDDYIEKNCLKTILDNCIKYQLDALAICSANIFGENIVKRFDYTDSNIYIGKDFMKENNFQICVPFTIYNRKFLLKNRLRFYTGIYHEDSEFSPRAYYLLNRIKAINDTFYFVNQNPNSITRTVNPKKSFDLIKICDNLRNFSFGIEEAYKQTFNLLISYNLNACLYNSMIMNNEDKKKLNVLLYENKHLFKYLIKSGNHYFIFEGFFFTVFRKKTVELYRLFRKIKDLNMYSKRSN